jgi:hypothetical protein
LFLFLYGRTGRRYFRFILFSHGNKVIRLRFGGRNSGAKSGICLYGRYAAQVTVENVSEDQAVSGVTADGMLPVTPSGNTIRIRIKDFDQKEHVYTLYLLSGADRNGYDTSTLNAFPESYRSGIWLLHSLNPAYTFVPYETGLSWTELMAAEDKKDKSHGERHL